jgi:hypothetical protein
LLPGLRDRDKTFPRPPGAPSDAPATPQFLYLQALFVGSPDGNPLLSLIIVRLLSPGPWLLGTTKVYSGVGADIVMESITPTTTVAILSTEGGVGLHASLNCAQLRPLRVPISALEFGGREDLNLRPPGSSARGSFQFLSH